MGVLWEAPDEEKTRQNKANSGDRDSIMAANFIKYFAQNKTKKALVTLNYRHALLQDMFSRKNAGRFIADAFPKKVANVYINSIILTTTKVTDRDVPETAISTQQNGLWEAAFVKTGKKDVAFNFAGTLFGDAPFDMLPFPNGLKYSDVFTGFVHYNYFADFRTVCGIEGFADDEFYKELIARYRLYGNEIPSADKLKANLNTVTETIYREEFPEVVKEIEKFLK